FDQKRHIAARSHRNCQVRHLKAKNPVKFAIKPNPVNRLHLLPVLQGHDKIEALLDANAANAEDGSHVNNTDPANLDVIASQLWRRRHQLAPFQRSDPCDVISYEAVAALDQAKDAFAFTDAAGAANQNAHAQNVYHAAELSDRWRKIHFKRDGRRVNKLHCNHRRAEHRDFLFGCNRKHCRIEMESARDNEAWNFAGTQRPKPPHPGFWSQALYIGMLGCAQDLHALLREISV